MKFSNKIYRLFSLYQKKKSEENSKKEMIFDLDRLRSVAINKKEIRLHFGCGPRVLKSWINIDLAYEPFEHYLQYYTDMHYPEEIRGSRVDFFGFDITKTELPLRSNTVDLIFHEDFFEHLCQKDQYVFLAESLRVLKPKCIHRINTPDLLESMKTHSDFSHGARGVFVEEWEKYHHLSVLTKKTLEEMALSVGYSQVVFTKRNKSSAIGLPLEYRPDPNDRPENGNIFADLIK